MSLYTPGLPRSDKNRALSGSLSAAQRELKNWGVLFTDGGRKKLITAEEARLLRSQGRQGIICLFFVNSCLCRDLYPVFSK